MAACRFTDSPIVEIDWANHRQGVSFANMKVASGSLARACAEKTTSFLLKHFNSAVYTE